MDVGIRISLSLAGMLLVVLGCMFEMRIWANRHRQSNAFDDLVHGASMASGVALLIAAYSGFWIVPSCP